MVLMNYNDAGLDGSVFFAFRRGQTPIKYCLLPPSDPSLVMVQWCTYKDDANKELANTFPSFAASSYMVRPVTVHRVAYITQPESQKDVFHVTDEDLGTLVKKLKGAGKISSDSYGEYPLARYFTYNDLTVLAVVLQETANHPLVGLNLYPELVHDRRRVYPAIENKPSPVLPVGHAFSLITEVPADKQIRRYPG